MTIPMIPTSWDHFVDGEGNSTTVSAGITTLMPLLSYRYESSTVGNFGAKMDMTALSAQDVKEIETRFKKGAEVSFDIKKRIPITSNAKLPLAQPFSAQTRLVTSDFSMLLESDKRQERIFVKIDYAQLPAENDFLVRVFINLPNADQSTPTTDIHYAGSFAFFGTGTGDGSGHPKAEFLVNVTETLQNLQRNELIRADEQVEVQLVAVPVSNQFVQPEMQLMLKNIEFIISPVHIRSK